MDGRCFVKINLEEFLNLCRQQSCFAEMICQCNLCNEKRGEGVHNLTIQVRRSHLLAAAYRKLRVTTAASYEDAMHDLEERLIDLDIMEYFIQVKDKYNLRMLHSFIASAFISNFGDQDEVVFLLSRVSDPVDTGDTGGPDASGSKGAGPSGTKDDANSKGAIADQGAVGPSSPTKEVSEVTKDPEGDFASGTKQMGEASGSANPDGYSVLDDIIKVCLDGIHGLKADDKFAASSSRTLAQEQVNTEAPSEMSVGETSVVEGTAVSAMADNSIQEHVEESEASTSSGIQGEDNRNRLREIIKQKREARRKK